MIGYIQGKVHFVSNGYIILKCGGIGYKVELGEEAIRFVRGEEKELYIHTHVRETELKLYGFENADDLGLFEMLIDVSGVGPKVALQLISQKGAENIIQGILAREPESLKVTGVGIKTADKIILELADKFEKLGYRLKKDGEKFKMEKELNSKIREAQIALKSLGYSSLDINTVITNIKTDEKISGMSTGALVKYLLSKM